MPPRSTPNRFLSCGWGTPGLTAGHSWPSRNVVLWSLFGSLMCRFVSSGSDLRCEVLGFGNRSASRCPARFLEGEHSSTPSKQPAETPKIVSVWHKTAKKSNNPTSPKTPKTHPIPQNSVPSSNRVNKTTSSPRNADKMARKATAHDRLRAGTGESALHKLSKTAST